MINSEIKDNMAHGQGIITQVNSARNLKEILNMMNGMVLANGLELMVKKFYLLVSQKVKLMVF